METKILGDHIQTLIVEYHLSGIQLFSILLFPHAEYTYPLSKRDNQSPKQ